MRRVAGSCSRAAPSKWLVVGSELVSSKQSGAFSAASVSLPSSAASAASATALAWASISRLNLSSTCAGGKAQQSVAPRMSLFAWFCTTQSHCAEALRPEAACEASCGSERQIGLGLGLGLGWG